MAKIARQWRDLMEGIRKPRILILTNGDILLYKLRKELILELIDNGNEVIIPIPKGPYNNELKNLGANVFNIEIDNRGTNFVNDIKLIINYLKIIKKYKPDLVITYTIKPNIYGGIASKISKVKFISNITGLGTSLENEGILKKITSKLYKLGVNNSDCIFYQNETNMKKFANIGVKGKNTKLVNGSGVNVNENKYVSLSNTKELKFITVSRVMKDKGVEEWIEAVKILKNKYRNISFSWAGQIYEDKYDEIFKKMQNDKLIEYLGFRKDINNIIKEYDCLIHPSHHEGLANVILESSAIGRPSLASNIPGCKEAIEDGITGLLFNVRDVKSLVNTIEDYINLSIEEKNKMSLEARKFIEKNFNRYDVINEYINIINKILEGEGNEII